MISYIKAKEYTDSQRLGYVDKERTVIVPETTYDGEELIFRDVPNPLKEGETYTVVFDGVEYKSKCFVSPEFNSLNSGTVMYVIGNLSELVDVEDQYITDVPFLIYYNSDRHTLCVNELNWDDGGHSVYVEIPETIRTIDPKYLPGVCLPVVELESVTEFGEPVELSESDGTKLDTVVGNPIVVRAGGMAMLFSYGYSDDTHTFMAPMGSATCMFAKSGSVWLAMVQ